MKTRMTRIIGAGLGLLLAATLSAIADPGWTFDVNSEDAYTFAYVLGEGTDDAWDFDNVYIADNDGNSADTTSEYSVPSGGFEAYQIFELSQGSPDQLCRGGGDGYVEFDNDGTADDCKVKITVVIVTDAWKGDHFGSGEWEFGDQLVEWYWDTSVGRIALDYTDDGSTTYLAATSTKETSGNHDIYTLTFTGNEFTIGANASDVETFWDNGWELDPDADGDGHCEVTMEVIEQ